jgi:hypothetical protein
MRASPPRLSVLIACHDRCVYQAHFYTCALAISEWHAVGATMIVGLDGTYAMPLSLTYRYSDSLLFDLKYVALGGAFFKDRSQLAMRVTYLLN